MRTLSLVPGSTAQVDEAEFGTGKQCAVSSVSVESLTYLKTVGNRYTLERDRSSDCCFNDLIVLTLPRYRTYSWRHFKNFCGNGIGALDDGCPVETGLAADFSCMCWSTWSISTPASRIRSVSLMIFHDNSKDELAGEKKNPESS